MSSKSSWATWNLEERKEGLSLHREKENEGRKGGRKGEREGGGRESREGGRREREKLVSSYTVVDDG